MSGSLFSNTDSASGAWFTAHCDGGSRGNPGPSGFGAVIEDPEGRTAARLSRFLGIQTNNYAEYAGMIAVLEWAIANGAKRLRVISDSELMVKQMNGQYKVASPGLRPLYEQARALARKLDAFEMRHTLRGGNKEADRLANEAMDQGMGKGRDPGPGIGGQVPGIRDKGTGIARTPPVSNLGAAKSKASPSTRQVLEGYVKDGVVHLLKGELPEGAFVKVFIAESE